MAWIKVRHDRYDKPPFCDLSPFAMLLYNAAECKIAGGLTDGHLSRALMRQACAAVGAPDDAVAELVAASLLVEEVGGYYMPNYLLDNPNAEDYERLVESKRTNGKKGGRPPKRAPRVADAPTATATQNLENLDDKLLAFELGSDEPGNLNHNLIANLDGNLDDKLDETYGESYGKANAKPVIVFVPRTSSSFPSSSSSDLARASASQGLTAEPSTDDASTHAGTSARDDVVTDFDRLTDREQARVRSFADYRVTDQDRAWAHQTTPLVTDIAAEADNLRDWCYLNLSKILEYNDPPAFWRRWMRGAQERAEKVARRGSYGQRHTYATERLSAPLGEVEEVAADSFAAARRRPATG